MLNGKTNPNLHLSKVVHEAKPKGLQLDQLGMDFDLASTMCKTFPANSHKNTTREKAR